MLQTALDEVERLYEEHTIEKHLPRDSLHVCTCGWSRRNGVCKYNQRPTRAEFESKCMTRRVSGEHTIGINPKISKEDDFIDTVRHELAHALAYAIFGESQEHNHNWRKIALRLGADGERTHHKFETEYEYYVYCPECHTKYGKTKRSKTVKQPFHRKCGNCEHSPLSSYSADQSPPSESGIVKVDSINWNNKDDWMSMGAPKSL